MDPGVQQATEAGVPPGGKSGLGCWWARCCPDTVRFWRGTFKKGRRLFATWAGYVPEMEEEGRDKAG